MLTLKVFGVVSWFKISKGIVAPNDHALATILSKDVAQNDHAWATLLQLDVAQNDHAWAKLLNGPSLAGVLVQSRQSKISHLRRTKGRVGGKILHTAKSRVERQ